MNHTPFSAAKADLRDSVRNVVALRYSSIYKIHQRDFRMPGNINIKRVDLIRSCDG